MPTAGPATVGALDVLVPREPEHSRAETLATGGAWSGFALAHANVTSSAPIAKNGAGSPLLIVLATVSAP